MYEGSLSRQGFHSSLYACFGYHCHLWVWQGSVHLVLMSVTVLGYIFDNNTLGEARPCQEVGGGDFVVYRGLIFPPSGIS